METAAIGDRFSLFLVERVNGLTQLVGVFLYGEAHGLLGFGY